VDTRLRKLDDGQYECIILAAAGLRRLGLADRITAPIATDQMVPAVGQGAIGIETRADDVQSLDLARLLNHEATEMSCRAERALLRALGGGCSLPIAAHAVVSGYGLELVGLVASRDGSQQVRDEVAGQYDQPEVLGAMLANRLLAGGAMSLLGGE
jgi:hydroxymethylbilane synthase